uniref:hypothetical protein n=1 Tax=Micromonospora sp. NBC_00855 TaxID=2975978 RepID=UPI0022575CF1|nr:hypothetical protein OHB51_35505 [Micromonospora sp. NBC_00855]
MSDPINIASSDDLHGDLVSELPGQLAIHLEVLARLGIHIAAPSRGIRVDPAGRVRIGWVQIENPGAIRVLPCEGITIENLEALVRRAMRARVDGAEPVGLWRRLSGGPVIAVFEGVAS